MSILIIADKARTLEKYRKHAMKNVIFTQFPEVTQRINELPICPQCERPALRDTRSYDPVQAGYITCPECAYHGPSTHPVKYHIENHVIPNR